MDGDSCGTLVLHLSVRPSLPLASPSRLLTLHIFLFAYLCLCVCVCAFFLRATRPNSHAVVPCWSEHVHGRRLQEGNTVLRLQRMGLQHHPAQHAGDGRDECAGGVLRPAPQVQAAGRPGPLPRRPVCRRGPHAVRPGHAVWEPLPSRDVPQRHPAAPGDRQGGRVRLLHLLGQHGLAHQAVPRGALGGLRSPREGPPRPLHTYRRATDKGTA